MPDLQIKGFWGQLRKRKVVRVALTYIFVGWILMQIGEIAFEGLGIPSWSFSLLIALLLLGFPIAVILAWAYEITPQGIRKDSAGQIESKQDIQDYLEDGPSIAVLPFADLSDTGDQQYFCEGIAEEVLNALCTVANLRVASRMAAFNFDSAPSDIQEIGRTLKVLTVLTGSVRKSGNYLRINVLLVNTTDGFHIWARQYDRKLEDIFEVQAEIASSITSALSITFMRKRVTSLPKVDPKAYDFFLRGLSYFARHTLQYNVYARQMFNRAISIDPNFGRAWAGLSYTHGFSYMYFNATDVNLSEARRTSAEALRLAPDLAESHVAAGIAHCMNQQLEDAEKEFERAIQLDPKNYDAWYFFGRAKVHEGDLERAVELFDRASRVRPEDYQSVLLQAQLYNSLGHSDKAIEVTREGMKRVRALLELNPDDIRALNMGAFALLRLGHSEEAKKWMSASLKNAPMDSIIQYNGACFYSLAGEEEQALDCLANCLIKVGNIRRDWLGHDSDMDNIRNHPRYADIISNFPE
jgi:TolB-like protein/Flp pilus assembly protein TadD